MSYQNKRRLGAHLFGAVSAFLLTAVMAVSAEGPAAEVIVTPQNPEIKVGDSIVITAEGRDKDGNVVPVSDPHWEADGQCGTITPDPNDPSKAIYTATAEGTDCYALCYQGPPSSGGAYASTDIRVVPIKQLSPYLTRTEVSPNNVKLTVGETQLFTATGYDQNGNKYQFEPIWSADGGTVNQNGSYTATIPGDFTVTASAQDSDITGEAKLTIGDQSSVYLEKIEVAPSSVGMLTGQQQLFTATGYDQNGNKYQFEPIWSADGGTVDQNGSYTATIPGDFTVTASAQGSDVTGEAKLTIGDQSSVYLEKIEVAPSSVSMVAGQQQLFTAAGYDQNGKPINFKPLWSADGGTVGANGAYTATKEGSFAVTAANQDGSVIGSAAVTVEAAKGDEAKPNAGWCIGGAALLALAAGAFLLQRRRKAS